MVLCKNLSTYHSSVIRWLIQAIICASITSLTILIPYFNDVLNGSGYWAIQSSLIVLEDTTGASVKKSFERVLGTIVGGFVTYAIYVLVTLNETQLAESHVIPLVLIYILFWPLPWGYIRYKYPNNVLIGTYGTFTGYIVILVSFLKQDAFKTTLFRIISVSFGVITTCVVTQFVFPVSARTKLNSNIADTLEVMAQILNPLLEYATGLQFTKKSQIVVLHKNVIEFIRNRDSKIVSTVNIDKSYDSHSLGVSAANDLVRQQKRKISSGSEIFLFNEGNQNNDVPLDPTAPIIYVVDRPVNSNTPILLRENTYQTENNTDINSNSLNELKNNTDKEAKSSSYNFSERINTIIDEFNDSLIATNEEYKKQFDAAIQNAKEYRSFAELHSTLFLAAKKEISFKREPTIFPEKKYEKLLQHVDILFNHIASLLFSLNIQIQHSHQARIESISAFKIVNQQGYVAIQDDINNSSDLNDVYRDNDTNATKLTQRLFSSVIAAFIFTDVFGSIIHEIVNNIHRLLIFLAKSIRNITVDYTSELNELIQNTSSQIDVLISLHQKRQKIYLDIFTTGSDNFFRGNIRKRKESDFGLASASEVYTKLPWEELMGIDARTFQQMSKSEHEVYWQFYWFVRDRLSVTTGTLLLLKDEIIIIFEIIKSIKSV